MLWLANYALKGPLQAALLAAAASLLSILLWPLLWVSGAVVALVTLRKGHRQGIVVTALAFVIGFAFMWLSQTNLAVLIGSHLLLLWVPVIALSYVLRVYIVFEYSFFLAAAIGALILSLLYLAVPDIGGQVSTLVADVLPSFDTLPDEVQLSADEYQHLLSSIAQVLPGMLVASVVFSSILSLLLARAWQARIYNPGGFQWEFHQLQLGSVLGVVAIVLVGLSKFWQNGYTLGLAMVVSVVYLFQGFAVLHAVVKLKELGRRWLVLSYALCLLMPNFFVLIIGGVGILDTWVNIRKRLAT